MYMLILNLKCIFLIIEMKQSCLVGFLSLQVHPGAMGGLFVFGDSRILHGRMANQINVTPLAGHR